VHDLAGCVPWYSRDSADIAATMTRYDSIQIGGGDTACPLCARKRLDIVKGLVTTPHPKLLDCGCGAGGYVRMFRKELGIDAWGVEYAHSKVSEAHRDLELKPFIQQGDLEGIPFADGLFDLAFLNEVLEHVPHETKALREIHRILKPNALLFVSAPNRWFPFETHGLRFKPFPLNIPHYLPFVPYIPVSIGRIVFHYHARNYWPSELRKLTMQCGFSIVRTSFLWPTFENISGHQPWVLRRFKTFLRKAADTVSAYPLIRRFGVSQVLILRKET
jgi:SAM-dependent methyltransferase